MNCLHTVHSALEHILQSAQLSLARIIFGHLRRRRLLYEEKIRSPWNVVDVDSVLYETFILKKYKY